MNQPPCGYDTPPHANDDAKDANVVSLDCLRVRRALQTGDDPSILAHVKTCAACENWQMQMQHTETALKAALNVPVPEHLADKILLQHQFRHRRLRVARWLAPALAASALLTLWWRVPQTFEGDWSMVAAEHVAGELRHLHSEDHIDPAQAQQAFAAAGLALPDLGFRIRFLDHCAMPGGRGLHVVLEDATRGRLSIVVAPDARIASDSGNARYGDFHAHSRRVGDRLVSVVSEGPHDAAWHQQVLAAIKRS